MTKNLLRLKKLLANFEGKRIGVIGDLMLDQFIFGCTERISPEASVPIVFVEKEMISPGGAGNVASNIASLGGKPSVLGIVGNDDVGRKLLRELEKRNVNIDGIMKVEDRPTTQKTRVLNRGQHMLRLDRESVDFINNEVEKNIFSFVFKNIDNWDGLVISNYAKGLITKNLAQKIIELANKNKKPIVGDIGCTGTKYFLYFKKATLFTPNHKEAFEIAKTDNLEKAGRFIQKQLDCSVLITQGPGGVTLFEGSKINHFPAVAKKIFDVSGAGDTVVAVFILAMVSGFTLEEAAILANKAAQIVIGKTGTAQVYNSELAESLEKE